MMRGGTSRGLFFRKDDLPVDPLLRDRVLIAALGSPHPLQVDGVGGGNPLTSKVAIVGRPTVAGADVDYLFAQVQVDRAAVDTRPTCGNLLAAVGPFALEAGLVEPTSPVTLVRIHSVNTGTIATAIVNTPGRELRYDGDCVLPGLDNPAAPISLAFEDAGEEGGGALLPTQRPRELIHDVPVTLAAYTIPVMMVAAASLGLDGTESPAELDARPDLFRRVEALRLVAGRRMGLGDVSASVVPKVAILSPPRNGGTITSRYLMPWKAHGSHAVTGALCIAAATTVPGSLAAEIAGPVDGRGAIVHVEHPAGTLSIELSDGEGGLRASLVRSARKLFVGEVFIPAMVAMAAAAPADAVGIAAE
jgi:2-methylaconitate cis-trans-isomerase PrpF